MIVEILICLLLVFLILWLEKHFSAKRIAGRKGEWVATNLIKTILNKDDILLTNVNISYDGRKTELDNLIINSNGVFIIEVKNYSGTLYGKEDDYEWKKVHISEGNNAYEKTVKNPIGQVKREVYLLSKYLKENHINVWVDGYIYFVEHNSPVKSEMVLNNMKDVDKTIHGKSNQALNLEMINKIKDLLKQTGACCKW